MKCDLEVFEKKKERKEKIYLWVGGKVLDKVIVDWRTPEWHIE
jgi:hypothetical protein